MAYISNLVGWIIVVVLLFVCAGSFTHAYIAKPRRPPAEMPLLLQAPPYTSTRRYTSGRTPVSMLPLRNDNGVFVVPILIGAQQIQVVVDTGSENLLVADKNCRGCDMGQGSYDPTRSGHNMPGKGDISLRFGTQSDDARFHVDDLTLVGVDGHVCDTSATTFGPILAIPSVMFALVHRRTGVSNFNIMGLCNVDGDSFINQITSPPHQQFTIYMHPTEGWLGFGDSEPIRTCVGAPDPTYLKLVEPPRGMPFAFYVSTIGSVMIGTRRLKHHPTLMLWDSGSNFSGCGPGLLAVLRENGLRSGGDDLTIYLPSTDGRQVVLTIPSSTYCWPDGTMLIDAHEPFPSQQLNEDVFILGSLFIQNYVLEFDLSRRRIGISIV